MRIFKPLRMPKYLIDTNVLSDSFEIIISAADLLPFADWSRRRDDLS
jgi:hypothetical protein